MRTTDDTSPMARRTHAEIEDEFILREAAEWVLVLESPASPECFAEWERWLSEDARHVQAFDRIAVLWAVLGKVHPTRARSQVEVISND